MRISSGAVLCLLVLGLIIACQPSASITVDDIVGEWRMELAGKAWGTWLFLNEDGTFAMTHGQDYDPNSPYGKYTERGRFELDGNKITFFIDESDDCPGSVTSSEIELTEDGKLQATALTGDCEPEYFFPGPVYTFSRIEP